MKLSTRSHYGLRAMAELACSYGRGPLSLADIAETEGLSLAYLEQLVALLRRAGLVIATRGIHGGYQLAREPKLISVGEIVRVLEGPLAPVECASEEGQSCCDRESACITRDVWVKMRESIAQVLDSTSLYDVCQSVQRDASLIEEQEGADGHKVDIS
ncbi:MAG: Rrf2 family transcriptional regulator [Chloroflexi bacterium]|nr:Rrf2 family transcriptional regulator [Chloroflexota bacterium]